MIHRFINNCQPGYFLSLVSHMIFHYTSLLSVSFYFFLSQSPHNESISFGVTNISSICESYYKDKKNKARKNPETSWRHSTKESRNSILGKCSWLKVSRIILGLFEMFSQNRILKNQRLFRMKH